MRGMGGRGGRPLTPWACLVLGALCLGGAEGGGRQQSESGEGVEVPWSELKQQHCNIGMQDSYRRPMFRPKLLSATCGVLNEDTDLDFSGKPCCCNFCSQRDPFEQLCEISKQICTSAADCIQRHHGECVEAGTGGGVEPFHAFWIIVVGGFTVAPFIIPIWALNVAEDIVVGLAG